jgi:hypothetical protein
MFSSRSIMIDANKIWYTVPNHHKIVEIRTLSGDAIFDDKSKLYAMYE